MGKLLHLPVPYRQGAHTDGIQLGQAVPSDLQERLLRDEMAFAARRFAFSLTNDEPSLAESLRQVRSDRRVAERLGIGDYLLIVGVGLLGLTMFLHTVTTIVSTITSCWP